MANTSKPAAALTQHARSSSVDLPSRRSLLTGADAAAGFIRRIARIIAVSPRRPSVITIERTGKTTALLKWGDGNPPWQVQRTKSPAAGPWENIGGPVLVRFRAVPIEEGCAFFRVVIALPASPGSGKKAVIPEKTPGMSP